LTVPEIHSGRLPRACTRRFEWSMGMADVDHPEPVSKPCDRNFVAGDLFARLVAAGGVLLRGPVYAFDLETRERKWVGLITDVVNPQKRWKTSVGLLNILISDEQEPPVLHWKWD